MLKSSNENISFPQFLSVAQAAKYLGVHAGTIRRWTHAKRLKGKKIGIQGDWRYTESDLLSLSNTLDEATSFTNLTFQETTMTDMGVRSENSHFVQFYNDEDFLIGSIIKFIKSGDTALVVVTPVHRAKLEKGLQLQGVDIVEAVKNGSYLCLDAEETLAKFMIDGMPDADLFFGVIGGIISHLSRVNVQSDQSHKKKLRAFGEMVALLWADGRQEAAVSLEILWNELQKIRQFPLFCAYPLNEFGSIDHTQHFEKIGLTHSHVIPAESYSSLTDEDKKLREIAVLQQKAQAFAHEIAEHKKTEFRLLETIGALKASEEFNTQIVENSADCIKILDLDGNLLSMNQPGQEILEIEDFQVFQGKDYREMWRGSYETAAAGAIASAKKGGTGRFQGFCPTAKGVPKWWDVVITPIYSADGKVERLLAVSRDITEFKKLDQRKDDFLSATSHELKTPLTSQKAFIQLLEQQILKNKDQKYVKYISKIHEQTNKLAKLVVDLLDASKVQAGKLVLNRASFDLNQTVREIVEEIQPISQTHKIIVKGELINNVQGDKEKLTQVVTNLLTNAIKYSPNADIVNVSLKQEKDVISGKRLGVVSVRDYGIGIDKMHQDKVFDRFYRVSDTDEKTYPGLGMGLYIASEIVKQHDGRLWIDSTKGKGSCFSFAIPLE